MKKTYIAPEVEIKRFDTEDIMTGSGVVSVTDSAPVNVNNTVDVTYNELFNA